MKDLLLRSFCLELWYLLHQRVKSVQNVPCKQLITRHLHRRNVIHVRLGVGLLHEGLLKGSRFSVLGSQFRFHSDRLVWVDEKSPRRLRRALCIDEQAVRCLGRPLRPEDRHADGARLADQRLPVPANPPAAESRGAGAQDGTVGPRHHHARPVNPRSSTLAPHLSAIAVP